MRLSAAATSKASSRHSILKCLGVRRGLQTCPTAGLRQGVAAVREFFGLLLNTFDIADFQPQDFLAAGDKVVVLGTSREGPKGSGRLVHFRWVHVFTFQNGRIVSFRCWRSRSLHRSPNSTLATRSIMQS